MKNSSLILLLMVQFTFGFQAGASAPAPTPAPTSGPKVKGSYVFTLDQKTGPVRELKIKIEDSEDMNIMVAKIQAKLKNGTQTEGEFVCEMGKAQHLNCRRDDDGGEFTLVMGKEPQLLFDSFDLADEGDENSIFVGSPDDENEHQVSGKVL